MALGVYPTGIVVNLNNSLNQSTVKVNGDPDAVAIFRLLTEYKINIYNRGRDLLDTILVTKRLVGPTIHSFINSQINRSIERNVSVELIDFLTDTVKYLQTGERSYDTLTWRELIPLANSSPVDTLELRRKIKVLKDTLSKIDFLPSEYIQVWISHDNGIEDLVYFLMICFGPRDLYESTTDADDTSLWAVKAFNL